MSSKQLSVFFLFVSLFGLAAVVISAFYPPPVEIFPMRKPLIGMAFVLLSVAGMTAVLFPSRCTQWTIFKKSSSATARAGESLKNGCHSYRGHHPDCVNFSAHVVSIGQSTVCAGCTGLFIGGLVGLFGAFVYFFTDIKIVSHGEIFIVVGSLAVAFGLLLPAIAKISLGSVRLIANAALPIGSFLMLSGVDISAQSISLDVFLLILIFFWLFTKISISQTGHRQVCRLCKNSDCESRIA